MNGLVFKQEKIENIWDELMVNHLLHWNEASMDKKHGALNPSFARYLQYERSGFFFMFTARNSDGGLVGNCGCYIMPSMHTQTMSASEDSWFLREEYRQGRNAINFYKFIECRLMELGAVAASFTCAPYNGVARIMEYLGYSLECSKYSKSLLFADKSLSSRKGADSAIATTNV